MRNTKPCSIIPPKDQTASYIAAITENPNNASNNASNDEISISGIGDYQKLWTPGRVLKIRFLEDVSPSFLRTFSQAITHWIKHVNLKFVIVPKGYADIRITTVSEHNKSLIGTDALTFAQNEATMHLETTPSDEYFESTVLHEMGHALGYLHEHLHRDATIPWNREKVYEHYFEHYGWDKQRVDENVLMPYSGAIVDTEYDKHSIMHYAVDKELTDGVWEVSKNTVLSELDIKMAKRTYPEDPNDVPWKNV
ncbi:M12 family metallopeptidase [Pseudomonas sp. LB3P93]